MHRLTTFFLACLGVCFVSQSALAGKHVALVIGNSSYQHAVALSNPATDSAAIAEMFKKASFDVVEVRRDLKNLEMRRALRDFSDKSAGADVAVVYYAGHGMELDGANYLVPVDASLERDTDAADEAIELERFVQAVEPAKLRLVILDACRINPFSKVMKRTVASRSLGLGLARVEPSTPNTFFAFAAKGGTIALDDKNNPFTAALLKYLTQPGVEVRKVFASVRDDVMAATRNKQEPSLYGSMGAGNITSLVPGADASPSGAKANMRRDYELADHASTVEAWDSFISAYPSGFYTDLAKAQREKLATTRVTTTEKPRSPADDRARSTGEPAATTAVPPRTAAPPKPVAPQKFNGSTKLTPEQRKQIDAALAAADERAAAKAKASQPATKP